MPVSENEVKTLLNDLIDRYGYDFTGYAEASLSRRITRLFQMDRFTSFSEFRYRILNDTDYFRRLVEQLTVNVTEMLRDPLFYKALREE
ncbi:MAG: protein-glutamate O-methyltransferase CheR, partial [Bacteroidota bacterium]|nr:protein-glutamate O-methyltransferase CheR [Bacteroidota bacterium]